MTTAATLGPDPRHGDCLRLRGADGSELVATAHGAHVIHWRPAGGEERLYLSGQADFGGSHSIRGGVPVVFPQFAALGPLPKHGLLRNRPWRLLSAEQPAAGAARARFEIESDAATRAIWPADFHAALSLELDGAALRVGLEIANTGRESFRFTAALHSYLRVADLAAVRIGGLRGLQYRDSADGGRLKHESAAEVAIDGEVDRIYLEAPAELSLLEAQRRLRIRAENFTDAVIWNPGATLAAKLTDLDEGGWRRFVCIESAVIGNPVELGAGDRWRGMQALVAE